MLAYKEQNSAYRLTAFFLFLSTFGNNNKSYE